MKRVLLLFATLILLNGCTQPSNPTTTPTVEQLTSIHDHGLFLQYAQQHGMTEKETQLFFQTHYNLNNETTIFDQLPPPPTDFETQQKMWEDGNTGKLATIEPNTYLQPEFYPTFPTTGITTWTHASGKLTPTLGIQSTPADQQLTINTETTPFETTLFLGSAWGVTSYQGMSFHSTITPTTDYTLDVSPNNVILGPTFPAFNKNWAEKLHVTGTITPQPGIETYTIRIYLSAPDPVLEEQWANQHQPYTRADGLFLNPEGIATLTIDVNT